MFATVPALVSSSDTAGHSATVTYPEPASAPGTPGNGFAASAGSDGNVVVRLTFWRPQRRVIPNSDPEGATWMDVGHLTYGVKVGGPGGGFCPQSAFSADDPNLTPASPHVFLQGGGGFDDRKNDEQSSAGDTSAGRTLTYTLNLSQCLAARGIPFAAGDEVEVDSIAAPGAPYFAQQVIAFKRQ